MSDYSNVYFDKILIYAEVNYFDDICKENDANKFIRELSKFFKVFGWKSKFINARGKLKLYFYGDYKYLMESHIKQVLRFKNYTNKCDLVDNKKRMYFEELENFLSAFSILFRNYIEKILNNEIKLGEHTNLAKFTPSVWFKGVSIYVTIPSTYCEDLEIELNSRFPEDLIYLEDFDYYDNIRDRKRVMILETSESGLSTAEIVLRFSPYENYSLTLCQFQEELPKYEIYKGINKIALNMFRYIWAGEFEKADKLLSYEEKKAYTKEKTLYKIKRLHKNLENYQRYQRLKSLCMRCPPKFPGMKKLHLEKDQLREELEKEDFFRMCSYSQRDFRVFELKVATLEYLIDSIAANQG